MSIATPVHSETTLGPWSGKTIGLRWLASSRGNSLGSRACSPLPPPPHAPSASAPMTIQGLIDELEMPVMSASEE